MEWFFALTLSVLVVATLFQAIRLQRAVARHDFSPQPNAPGHSAAHGFGWQDDVAAAAPSRAPVSSRA